MAAPCVALSRPGVALIGGGFIGPVHAEALRRLGVPVVGFLGSSPERSRPVADRLGVERIYRDLDELLADPLVESVHVASPNRFHRDQSLQCLNAGKHVVCEKPLGLSSQETSELLECVAGRPELAHAVCYNIRFYPLCQEMNQRVQRGDLGRVVAITGSYTQDWLVSPRAYNWRVESDGVTNLRAVADIGTHWMDLAQFVSGKPIEEVFAELSTVHQTREQPQGGRDTFSQAVSVATKAVPIETEDQAFVLLRLADGVRGSFHVSQVHPGRKNRLALEVVGTEGSLVWDSEDPNLLWIGRHDRSNKSLIRDPGLLSGSAGRTANYPGGHAEGFPDTFVQLFRAVYDRLGDSTPTAPSYPTFLDGHREVLLCEAIAKSAREAAWVKVPRS